MLCDYEKQVYTAVLGKVLGVYLGRPYEGWSMERIREHFGEITRYVHEDLKVPLVVTDDDITGTLTFIRALEDSGKLAETPPEFFGETWLNYLLEGQTILWWGGMSLSTEHTAYLRLKSGVKSPESGSMERNGREVAEQIGAQIFIDCFGMVAPGNPLLAAELAKKAAGVSHDGEAVYAAQIVAAMVSLAFECKDMERLLDEAIQVIPRNSLIAQVHRDVRSWCREYSDWHDTYEKIREKYGYQIFGGNCHVIPNHAVMVMAWSYGQNDFYDCLRIACSAGWDTDCNAGNVGSIAAMVAGLEHINDRYDFQGPPADRIMLPTADGTDSTCDILHRAWDIASLGRKLNGWPQLPAPKTGAWFHFEMPTAVQGFQADCGSVRNVPALEGFTGKRCLEWELPGEAQETFYLETPIFGVDKSGGYSMIGTPLVYCGNTLRAKGRCEGVSELRMILRLNDGNVLKSVAVGQGEYSIEWQPEWKAGIAEWLGFEATPMEAGGRVFLDFVDFGGQSCEGMPAFDSRAGWISNMNRFTRCFSNDRERDLQHAISNGKDGIFVTGNRRWKDKSIHCQFKIHSADRAGILFDYQGLKRWNGLLFTKRAIQIVNNLYGETILAEVPWEWKENALMEVNIQRSGKKIIAQIDNQILRAEDASLLGGGVGMYIDTGLAGWRELSILAES